MFRTAPAARGRYSAGSDGTRSVGFVCSSKTRNRIEPHPRPSQPQALGRVCGAGPVLGMLCPGPGVRILLAACPGSSYSGHECPSLGLWTLALRLDLCLGPQSGGKLTLNQVFSKATWAPLGTVAGWGRASGTRKKNHDKHHGHHQSRDPAPAL